MTMTVTIDGVDVTDKVRLDDVRLQMCAIQGQVGAGSIIIDDTTGTADLAPIATEWSVEESEASPTTIAGGYVAEERIERGPLRVAAQRQFRPVLEDWNTALTDRVLRGPTSNRPEETDYERVSWLIGQSVLGMLDGVGHIPNTNTVTMPATDYWGKRPLDVLDDCADASDKNFYIYWKAGTGWVLYYDTNASTEAGFTSTLKVSDDPADVDNETVFGPSDVEYEVDPERIYSGLLVKYDGGQVFESNDTTEATYRRLQRAVIKQRYKTAAKASAYATRQLARLDEPTKRLTLTVSVPGSALGELRAGMRIHCKLRSRGITAYTYFRIATANISFRQGLGASTDVEYDVRLEMRDRIRPVNLDDDFGGGDSSGHGGTGGGGGDGGGGGGGGGTTDTGAYPLDDFARTSEAGFGSVATVSTDTVTQSEGNTSFAMALPDGCATVGRFLLACIGWTDRTNTDVDSAMEAEGWTKLLYTPTYRAAYPDYAANWYWHIVDGTETWIDDGIGDELTLTFIGATSNIVSIVDLLDDVYDDGGPYWVLNPGESADPDSLSDPGWGSVPARWWTFLLSDGTAISGEPSGYDNIGSGSGTGIAFRASAKDGTADAEDPSAYTCAAPVISYTLVLRGNTPGGGAPDWGSIPLGETTGAPWEGGNTWIIDVTSGAATFSTNGSQGQALITADGTEAVAELTSDGEPSGPWDGAIAAFTTTWQVDTLGDTADADPNTIEFAIYTEGWFGGIIVNLGDGVDWAYMDPDEQRGIVIWQGTGVVTYSDFVAKTLAVDTDYCIKLDTRGTRVRGKLWAASTAEPIAWDIDVPRIDVEVSGSTLDITISGNTTGGNVLHSFESIDVELGGAGLSDLPPGDGVETTWTILPWVPGTLKVWVDGILTVPVSTDRLNGTFTFDRAPSDGAVIRAEYTPA